ncbi:helix-turn-helix transcriptional regulator [Ancylobacter sp. 6x-1]|uniref:Helix-turn-helix transcriptional regulator n=1 Tax=Ancylobacter crimeensis TaxID=2579147 RepID=A0ABT0DAM4_9HYPH|nr:helix-turn-helix transcriptional regulator [Ancylobacter crimeensis]MCK0196985.1 helix-turn-helix transcriptional regulator [Ancylobacter crimeensis]
MNGHKPADHVFANVARPVVALGTDYPDGHIVAPHHHGRDQLLYGATGVVLLNTPHGAWVMPPERGMWIPAGMVHDVRMMGEVRMRSLYMSQGVITGMPPHCQVLAITPLMRSLLAEAVAVPAAYDPHGRDGALMQLIQHEIPRLPALPLSLPLPGHPALARLCRNFLLEPTHHARIEDWSDAIGASRRTFTRLFRRETGLSFVAWRQQACVMAALPRLAAGHPVTEVAIDLGYDNPAAFTTMFKRILGAAPASYIGRDAS